MPSMPEPRRAVVIEDDPDIRGLLVRILVKQGFEVTQAEAGLPGVEEVRRAKPDLITLDLNLPDLDGLEVCKLLREFSDAFIVMLTARADELDKLTGLDNGADDYISKPFSPRELQSRINALFRRRQPSIADTAVASELERATEVQQSLLPQEDLRVDGYDVAGDFRPSRSVGGDFYDWYRTPEGLHLTFADAMGKGMGAALIAATVRAVMRSTGQRQDLDAAFASASKTIAADLDSSNSFVTLFHARLDAASGVVSYVDAGHGLALHVTAEGSAHRLPSGGPPVGAWAGSAWPQSAVGLAPGDSLVVVSDGVLDVFDSVEKFTEAVLAAAHGQGSAQSASDAIMALAPAETAEDDVTVVVVRRLPEPAMV
ncbi:SpoIIE family protein phosphatase [Pseudarthrobacter psychrotolerans]|uniref:SpoIIE family protein phosphatase n=1 Tax=Pseudarthrobacter psychrotolerans TaxID=2697569 RepID=A0A6P1NNM3_9MICC|nr:SpoIIE family protein phosphatase [Pseudarthrobacter psychrotolerans]QHK20683.1 SpoIIE family protein phosphatase [Pseudarthrobacter psychrotolerans]